MEINLWIGNLAAYNRGDLVGEWISLPLDEDELKEKIKEILGHDEEFEIFDYEADFKISPYDNPYRLNTLAEELQTVDSDVFMMIQRHYYPDVHEALEVAKSGNYMVLDNIESYRDLAQELVYSYEYLGDEIPKRLEPFLDWDAIADNVETGTEWQVDTELKKAICLMN